MKKRVNRRSRALLIVALLILSGCKKSSPPPSPPATPASPRPAAAKPVQPVQAQASSAKSGQPGGSLLDFSAKKDPFKPFVVEPAPGQTPGKLAARARRGNLLPIQSYEVNKFRVSGIITGLKENTALVLDPTGKGYVVREGMLIGINDGRIARITPSAIEVREQYRDDNGHLRKRTVILTLPKKK